MIAARTIIQPTRCGKAKPAMATGGSLLQFYNIGMGASQLRAGMADFLRPMPRRNPWRPPYEILNP